MARECLHCEQGEREPGSNFCSPACRREFAKTMPFVLACWECSADEGDCQTVEEATAAGWDDVVADPEGFCWNYIGLCPDCKSGQARTP